MGKRTPFIFHPSLCLVLSFFTRNARKISPREIRYLTLSSTTSRILSSAFLSSLPATTRRKIEISFEISPSYLRVRGISIIFADDLEHNSSKQRSLTPLIHDIARFASNLFLHFRSFQRRVNGEKEKEKERETSRRSDEDREEEGEARLILRLIKR